MATSQDRQARLDAAAPRVARVEATAGELHKAVDVGIDVGEVARLGRELDVRVSEAVTATATFGSGPVAGAFATCNGVAYSLAGHAEAAVGFSAMSNRSAWKSRWDQVWSEWQRALTWRDRVLEAEGLHLAHRLPADGQLDDPDDGQLAGDR